MKKIRIRLACLNILKTACLPRLAKFLSLCWKQQQVATLYLFCIQVELTCNLNKVAS